MMGQMQKKRKVGVHSSLPMGLFSRSWAYLNMSNFCDLKTKSSSKHANCASSAHPNWVKKKLWPLYLHMNIALRHVITLIWATYLHNEFSIVFKSSFHTAVIGEVGFNHLSFQEDNESALKGIVDNYIFHRVCYVESKLSNVTHLVNVRWKIIN